MLEHRQWDVILGTVDPEEPLAFYQTTVAGFGILIPQVREDRPLGLRSGGPIHVLARARTAILPPTTITGPTLILRETSMLAHVKTPERDGKSSAFLSVTSRDSAMDSGFPSVVLTVRQHVLDLETTRSGFAVVSSFIY